MNANPLTDMKMPVRRFADGGKVETAEELMARMNAKYGVSGKTSPTPQPAAPKPVVTALVQPASPSIAGAANVLKNRKQQIDEAAGYACGGKIKAHANGGKISGPGTPTSDSIPAKVSETGEQIAVSTDERILSGAQDAFLEKIAQDLGFPDLDAMLEAGTGKPVGPTIKAGKKAAATGLQPENPLTAYQPGSVNDPHASNPTPSIAKSDTPYQEATRNAPVQNMMDPVDSLFPVRRFNEGGKPGGNDDSLGTRAGAAVRSGVDLVSKANDILGAPRRFITSQAKDYVNALLGTQPAPVTGAQERTFGASPSTAQPGAQERTSSATPTAAQSNPLLNDNYRPMTSPKQTSFTEIGTKESQGNPLTTINMNANNESLARANAIREGDGSGPKVTMLGNSALTDTQNLMDKWSREDGTAAAMNQAIANPKSAGAIASLASSQMANDTNRQSSADANALTQQGRQLSADVTKRGQDINAREAAARLAGNPLANALTQVQTDVLQSDLDDKKRAAAIMEEIQDPKTTPERRKALLDSVLAPLGKTANDNRYVPHSVKTYNDMGQITGETAMMFDKQTGQYVTPNGAPASIPPLPPKDQLKAGQTYATRNGPAVWNGSEFVPANT